MRLSIFMLPLVLGFACCVRADESAPTLPTHPTLEVTTLEGEPWSLAARRGRWVVVNFWATWCKPCIKEIPDLSELDQRRDDLEIIGLAYEEIDAKDLAEFLTRHPASYPVAIIDVYAPPADFETPRGLPLTYLIAPDGAVARQFLGPVTSTDIETAMLAAVAPPAAVPAKPH